MPKLIIMQGLPGSGKTSKAFDLMLENPKLERMSIKTMTEIANNPTEKLVQKAIELFHKKLLKAIDEKKDIIIDDANLHPWHVNAYRFIAKQNNYEFEVVKMNTPVEECYGRIIKRHQYNARAYSLISKIKLDEMAERLVVPEEKENAEFVVYGLEDCIADTSERRFFASKGNIFQPGVFYSKGLISLDEIKYNILLEIYNDLDAGYKIVIVTKRPDELRAVTEEWLKDNNVPYHTLIMKSKYVFSPEHIWKYAVLENKFNIHLCKKIVDDNEAVLRHFEQRGIEAVDCGKAQTEKIA